MNVEKDHLKVCNGLKWFRIRSSGGLLWKWGWMLCYVKTGNTLISWETVSCIRKTMYHGPSDYRYSIEGLLTYNRRKMFMYVSEVVGIIKCMKQFQSVRYYFAAHSFVTFGSETRNLKKCSPATGKQFHLPTVSKSVAVVNYFTENVCNPWILSLVCQ